VALVYKKTGNLRACQLLLGHRKLESTVRYLALRSTMRWSCRSNWRSDREGGSACRPAQRPQWVGSGRWLTCRNRTFTIRPRRSTPS
jgi:hypothetical protein